jgi:hypothetical protein
MSTSSEMHELWNYPAAPPSERLDEAVWQAWVDKGRARDRRNSATRFAAVKWISVAALAVVAGLWSHLGPYDVVVRFVLAAGAIVLMLHGIPSGNYALAAAFGALALLYNPIVPVFSFSGEWQRAVVVASAAPFVASLALRPLRTGTQ